MSTNSIGNIVISYDIGGTHVSAAAVDIKLGRLYEPGKSRFSIDKDYSPKEIFDRWARAGREAAKGILNDDSIAGWGVAMPGPFDYDRGICLIKGLGKYDSLYGADVRTTLKNLLNIPSEKPIIFGNDGICSLLGEHWRGAAMNHNDVISLTLGTGFGSAFMRDGEVISSGDGMPETGWFYNVPFKESLADDYFSSRGLINLYLSLGGKPGVSAKEIAGLSASDNIAQKTFKYFGHNLAEFLSPWLVSFKPTCVVLGGNISKSFERFGSELIKRAREISSSIEIKPSSLFEDAILYGAALLPVKYKERQ